MTFWVFSFPHRKTPSRHWWLGPPSGNPRRTALGIERLARTSMPSANRTTGRRKKTSAVLDCLEGHNFRSCCFFLGVSRSIATVYSRHVKTWLQSFNFIPSSWFSPLAWASCSTRGLINVDHPVCSSSNYHLRVRHIPTCVGYQLLKIFPQHLNVFEEHRMSPFFTYTPMIDLHFSSHTSSI